MSSAVLEPCGERHCPLCSGGRKQQWLDATAQRLSPQTSYLQVVFTVSDRLIPLFTANPERMYRLLMKVAWDQLERELIAAGVQPGAIIVLHTWNQRLQLHPHLHCLIPVAAQYEYQQSTERVGERSINSLPSPAGTNGN